MTGVYGFTMFKLNSEILKLYGRLMDDTELPADVQTGAAKPAPVKLKAPAWRLSEPGRGLIK